MNRMTKFIQQFPLILILLIGIFTSSCAQNNAKDTKQNTALIEKMDSTKYKVTFIELGSVRCLPCQQMQPVMNSIEEKYTNQVNVVFHDVWTPEGKPYGQKYGITAIPTQVFLDENGNEFFRHEGFFAEDEIVKVLKTKNVK